MHHKWYSIFPTNPWLSIYAWAILCFMPFFFIFKSSSPIQIVIGIIGLILFFVSYRFSFKSKSGLVYMWISFEMVINIIMTILFGFVYFSLFTAFFIGNIRNPVGFYIIYGLHIATTLIAIVFGVIVNIELFLPQFQFVIITVIGTVLLPFHLYNRNKQENLEVQLEDANERISELIIIEERHRIARDLHDTLGQKLSLIGLKSDLASRLIEKDQQAAKRELQDIRQTASTALNEVRELVSNMRATKISAELIRASQILKAAEMNLTIDGEAQFEGMSPIVENVLSMCLKESITNVVKHSFAKNCYVTFKQDEQYYKMLIEDDGIGIPGDGENLPGSGLDGIRERLEFINGKLEVDTDSEGTKLIIRVPIILKSVGG